MNNIGQYSKAFVPLVVMGFGMLGSKLGYDFGVDANAANVLLTLVLGFLTFLVPNSGGTPVQNTPVVPVVVTPPVVVQSPVEEAKPNILRKVS